jgi:hypothetical protein
LKTEISEWLEKANLAVGEENGIVENISEKKWGK